MTTRLRQKMWLIEKCTPAPDEDKSCECKKASQPICEAVYLNFRALHDHLQTITKRNSKTYDTAKKIASEVIEWWKKTKQKLEQKKVILVYLQYLHSHNCDIKASIDKVQHSSPHQQEKHWPTGSATKTSTLVNLSYGLISIIQFNKHFKKAF